MPDENPSDFSAPYRALIEHCERNNLKFVAAPERKSVSFFLSGQCAIYSGSLEISPDDEIFRVRMGLPVLAKDPAGRALVSEVLTRANHGLALGAFDIDMDDGDISYHIGQIILGERLEDEMIGGLVATALAAADRYFPGLMRVMFAGHTPDDAVYLCELDLHADCIETPAPPKQTPPAPPSAAPAPPRAKAKRRRPRKDSKQSRELPGLFETPETRECPPQEDPPADS